VGGEAPLTNPLRGGGGEDTTQRRMEERDKRSQQKKKKKKTGEKPAILGGEKKRKEGILILASKHIKPCRYAAWGKKKRKRKGVSTGRPLHGKKEGERKGTPRWDTVLGCNTPGKKEREGGTQCPHASTRRGGKKKKKKRRRDRPTLGRVESAKKARGERKWYISSESGKRKGGNNVG